MSKTVLAAVIKCYFLLERATKIMAFNIVLTDWNRKGKLIINYLILIFIVKLICKGH